MKIAGYVSRNTMQNKNENLLIDFEYEKLQALQRMRRRFGSSETCHLELGRSKSIIWNEKVIEGMGIWQPLR